MASKAKSGMSAVRQYSERIRLLTPPNVFTAAAASFTGPVNDGQGHSAFHAGVSNNTSGTLKILMAWRSTGPFVLVFSKVTAADPITGLFTAEIVAPVVRRFIKVVFDAPGPGLGVDFELGTYFEPRADSGFLEIAGGVPASITVVTTPPAPGTTITAGANTPVPAGPAVALPAPPAGTLAMTVQNVGGAGSIVLVREVGGAAGTGFALVRFAAFTFEHAVAPLEAELVAGVVTVGIVFERP
jgi:hypothetical protein